MAYVKNTWVDQAGQIRYEQTTDEDDLITLTPNYELITEIGTPVNATNMNHIEDGIADCDTAIGQKVSKSGDTMTGNLDFNFATLDLSSTVASNTYAGVGLLDTNGNRLGRIEAFQKTDGSYGVNLGTKKYGVEEYPLFAIGYNSSNNKYATLDAPLTMTGELIISKNTYQQLQLKNPNQTAGTTPGSESNMGIRFYDSGSTYVGYIQNSYGTDGSRYMLLNCRNGASTNGSTIKWGFDGNGNANLWLPNSTCIDGQWINSQTLLTSTTTGNNTITADLSNYLPNDGQKYEVKMWYNFYDYGDNNGKVCPETDIFLQNNTTNKTYYLDSGNQYSRHNCFEITLPVGTSRWVKTYFEDANTTRYWWAIGYRRIGTNG